LHPAWSPDGKSLAFLRTAPDRKELVIVPAAGGAERKVIESLASGGAWEPDASTIFRSPGPEWLPDGRHLALSNRPARRGPDRVYIVSLDRGEQHPITFPEPDSLGDANPAISPNGRQLAFVRASGQRGITDLFVVPLSGGVERRLTFDEKTISGVAWASDNRIVFTSNRQNGNRLWSIAARGGAPELIPIASQNVTRVSSSPRSRRLVVVDSFSNTNVWRIDLSRPGSQARKLISTTRRNDSASYSPDGTHIVFVSDRSGSNEIWVSDAEGGHARRITSFRGQPVGTPRWSPDGRDIVFDAARSGRSVICTVSAYSEGTDGGDAKLFQEDRWDNMMPSWSGDGRFIYFVSRRDNNLLLLFKKQLNDGAVTQLAHRSGGEGLEAPGRNTVFFSDGKNGIWQVSTAGGDEIPLPGLEHVRHRRYFAATRRGLYFLQQDSPPWFIGLYDYASHTISRIAEIQKQPLFNTPSLAVSPDGRWIIYGQLDDGGSDILMVEDFQ
jgi:Tol biopolymer transport system component